MAAKKTRPSAKKQANKKPAASTKKAKKAPASVVEMKPTHDQIAQRAKQIWTANGCPQGQDEANWLAAEAELMAQVK